MRAAIVALLISSTLRSDALALGPGGSEGSPSQSWKAAALYGGDVRSLAISTKDPLTVLAGTAAGHVYVSHDGGESWADAAVSQPLQGYVITSLLFDPGRPTAVFAALQGMWGGGGVALSEDEGKSWTPRQGGLPAEAVFAIHPVPRRAGAFLAALPSGVYQTIDEGRNWQRITSAYPEIENVSSLWIDPDDPRTILAGTWRRAYRSDDGGASWRGVFEGMALDSEVFSLHGVFGRPTVVWASTCGWVYRSLDRGERWVRFKDGLDERRTPSFRPLPDGRLMAGTTGGLYESSDDGRSWHLVTSSALVVQVIAVHPGQPDRILLGTEGAGVWVSRDGGRSFEPGTRGMTNLRISGLVDWGGQLLVAVRHAGSLSGIYRSTDSGRSFAPETFRIPTVTGLSSDAGRVFAATEEGLYERRGTVWQAVPGVGAKRIVDLDAQGGRQAVLTTAELLLRRGGKVTKVSLPRDEYSSVGLVGEELWVSGRKGMYVASANKPERVATPILAGRLLRAGAHLVLCGNGGIWLRRDRKSSWSELSNAPSHSLPTGDPKWPVLFAREAGVQLFDPATGFSRVLPLPAPWRDTTAALVSSDKLWLGTSGYGLWSMPLGAAMGGAASSDYPLP